MYYNIGAEIIRAGAAHRRQSEEENNREHSEQNVLRALGRGAELHLLPIQPQF
jgi:hypothetical protein